MRVEPRHQLQSLLSFRLFTNTAAVGSVCSLGLILYIIYLSSLPCGHRYDSSAIWCLYQLENWKGLGTETGHTGMYKCIYVYIALTRVKNPLCSLDRAAAQNLQQIV